MTQDHVRVAFQKAIGIFVDEKGRIKERLLVAYASQLSTINPQNDLPSALKDDFRDIRYTLSDEGMPYGYGEHAASKLDDMSEEEASELAQKLFAIFVRLVGAEQYYIA